ncbi:MAG: alkylhydroperoxidase, partial [Actinobacteria bacterium]|nr:alkylhydroperoxidase [Actinomycetota bacterium]
TVLGLGCSTEGDIIGLSPNDSNNPDDWSHS